jgi:2-keto-4-pentenoate hydratase
MNAEIVAALDAAERNRQPIPPLTSTWPELTPEAAYAVQSTWLEQKRARGGRLVGRKVGLTSHAMQQQLGVNEPDFGFLLADMLLPSATELQRSELLQPRVEPEIAFWLSADLRGPGITADDVLKATRGVSAALEIVDSRIADWRITLADTIADNGSSARAVISERVVPVSELDLANEKVRLFRNDELVGEGRGADVLGHPAEAVAWLANRLSGFGQGLHAGDVVLPGAMCASVFGQAGETFRADLDHLGTVRIAFV